MERFKNILGEKISITVIQLQRLIEIKQAIPIAIGNNRVLLVSDDFAKHNCFGLGRNLKSSVKELVRIIEMNYLKGNCHLTEIEIENALKQYSKTFVTLYGSWVRLEDIKQLENFNELSLIINEINKELKDE